MPSHFVNWSKTNQNYVRRGTLYFSLEFLDNWDDDLQKMNSGKRGHPFEYPEQFIWFLAVFHFDFHIPYRQSQGAIQGLAKYIPKLKDPHFTQIRRRVMNLDQNALFKDVDLNQDVAIAVDSSGLKVASRGDWIRKQWTVRKGWLKIHIATTAGKVHILGVEVTNERVHDRRKFKSLVASSCRKRNVLKVFADGAYDAADCFDELDKRDIEPGIRMRKDAVPKLRGHRMLRSKCVRERDKLGGQDAWSKANCYGDRWTVESAFGSFKNLFGEHVSAKTFWNRRKEVKIKFGILNMLLAVP
jgi:hypothetical protein